MMKWRMSRVDSLSAEVSVSVGSGRLTVDRVGVAYSDQNYSIVVPWHGISRDSPVAVTVDGRLKLGLCSDQPGVGFLVDKAKYSTDDLYDECPVEIDGAALLVDGQLGGDVEGIARVIADRRRRYGETVEKMLPGGPQSIVGAVTAVDFRSRAVTIDTRRSIQYPLFCPVTGDVATGVLPCTSNDGRAALSVLASERAISRLQWISRICSGTAVGAIAVYAAIGSWMLLASDAAHTTIWSGAWYSLPVFAVIPFAFWITRPRIHVSRVTDVRVRVKFDDRDYFQAFIALNGACSTLRL